jgi:excisionase family DNA binding protein
MSVPFSQRLSCTIEEACEGTGLGRAKIYQEIAAGRVETCKVGRRTLVIIESLVRLIQSTSERAHEAANDAPTNTRPQLEAAQ